MRAINPGGAVRLGVFGSLSATSSSKASRVRSATAAVPPIQENARDTFSQPRCVAHAVHATGASDRNPVNSPIRKANTKVTPSPCAQNHLEKLGVSFCRRFLLHAPCSRCLVANSLLTNYLFYKSPSYESSLRNTCAPLMLGGSCLEPRIPARVSLLAACIPLFWRPA